MVIETTTVGACLNLLRSDEPTTCPSSHRGGWAPWVTVKELFGVP